MRLRRGRLLTAAAPAGEELEEVGAELEVEEEEEEEEEELEEGVWADV